MPTRVTAYVITYNEEQNLRETLPTITWADEILVIDSFSTDRTADVCKEFGARHVNEKFTGFGAVRNRALELASNDWIVSIDTDERSTPEFAAEVRRTLLAPSCAAYFVPRLNYFFGKPIRTCGWYPDYRQPQVFDRRQFRYCPHLVHESFECDGKVGHFKNHIVQIPFPTLAVALRKNERYSTLMAERYFKEGRRASFRHLAFNPLAGFLKKYVVDQGIRDGTRGLMISALHASYTFLKYAKLWELQRK